MAVIIISHVAMILILLFDFPRLDCHWKIYEDEEEEDKVCPIKIDEDTQIIVLTWISVLTVVLDIIIMALP